MKLYKTVFKRILDIVASLVLLLLCGPLLIVLAILVRLNLGSPVIFRQQRPGFGGKVFTMFKFRTMRDAVGADGKPLPDDQRLTIFGKALRSTSLDELPELWNILRGEMSFVGPRPLRVEYLPRYSKEQSRRHEVRPGLTGLAQVSGRNLVSWSKRFKYDIEYVEKVSFVFDLYIVLKTFAVILRRSDISSSEHATMPEFKGENQT